MAKSAELLAQLKTRYTDKLELSLDRMQILMDKLDNPQTKLPRVIHVSGSNGKESVLAFIQSILYASGIRAHKYTSNHLASFNERIGLSEMAGTKPISEKQLVEVLTRVIKANGDAPLTFFEATTAAALLAFSETPADILLVGAGQGGGVDPTNIIPHKDLTVITPASIDKSPMLGETIAEIALEYSGIMRPKTPCIVGHQSADAAIIIENYADQIEATASSAGKDWMIYEQHGRLIYQGTEALIDLQLPRLNGPHQIANAGMAIAAVSSLKNLEITEEAIEIGLQSAQHLAQLQPLAEGPLYEHVYEGSELWLDSGHRRDDALILAQAMADFEERVSSPLHIICAIKQGDDPKAFFTPFDGLAEFVATITVPEVDKLYSANDLAAIARDTNLNAAPQAGLEEALQTCRSVAVGPARVLICGSLELAGYTLARYYPSSLAG